jgi:uncharacterized protein YdcH (DUF465 family)
MAHPSQDGLDPGNGLAHARLLHKLEALDDAIAHLERPENGGRNGSLERLRQLREEIVLALGLADARP